jgi:hypothetical protein
MLPLEHMCCRNSHGAALLSFRACPRRQCTRAGSTFELLLVTASRAGVNTQLFTEDSSPSSSALQQPATGWPVGTAILPGVLSMQVMLEQQHQQQQQGGAGPSCTHDNSSQQHA